MLLANTSTHAYAVAIYTGTGSGTFDTPVVTAAGYGTSSGAQPDSIAAADFNGGTDTDLVFTTDDGLLLEMIPTSGGSMGSATSLTLPPGHTAIGVDRRSTTTAMAIPTSLSRSTTPTIEETAVPSSALDLLTGNGSGGFSEHRRTRRSARPITIRSAWSPATSRVPPMGLEVAVPISNGGADGSYVDIVPLSSSGTWGNGIDPLRRCLPLGGRAHPDVDHGRQYRGRRLQWHRQAEHRAGQQRRGTRSRFCWPTPPATSSCP